MNQGEKKLILLSAFILLVAAINTIFPKISLVGVAFAEMPELEIRPTQARSLKQFDDSVAVIAEDSLVQRMSEKTAGASKVASMQTESQGTIGINTSTEQELQRIKGVGPALAKRIITFRNQHGPFKSGQSLQKVKGIGPKKAKNILSQVKFD